MSLRQVAAALPYLTPYEREEVVARSQALGLPGFEGRFPDLYAALLEVLREYGCKVPPRFVLERRPRFKMVLLGLQELHAFCGRLVVQRPQRAERVNLEPRLIRLCIEHLRARSRPIDIYTVGTSLRYLDEVVEDAFPGYSAAGLLPGVLWRKKLCQP